MPPKQHPNDPWLKHLIDTFMFIDNNAYFDEISSLDCSTNLNVNPKQVVSSFYSFLLTESRRQKHIAKIIIPLLEIPILDEQDKKNQKLAEKHRATFLIGGWMEFNNGSLISYSFSICILFATIDHSRTRCCTETLNIESCCLDACKDNKRVSRRIHFDYQPDAHPQIPFHVQIGGEFPKDERSFQDLHYCFDHFLEQPRLPCPKIDFLILLDFMIREFNTPLKKWRDDPQWNKLVGISHNLLDSLKSSE